MLTTLRFGLVLVALMLAGVYSSAQRMPPNLTPVTPSRQIPRPDSVQDAGVYGYWSHMTEQDRVGGALMGKVVVKDELLPWDPIIVSVSCNGTPVYTAETDSKGYFAVLPSRIPGELSLQGDRQRQMQVHFEGCILEASLTGFSSSTLTVTEHNLRDSPEVGTITLTREFDTRGTAMSATSKLAPIDAAKHWSKAGEEMLADKPDRAQRQLEEAVRAYPGFADAWYRLGILRLHSNPADAQICLRKAAVVDPAFVPPYEQLAGLAVEQGNWPDTLQAVAHFLQLDAKGNAHIWYYSALSNFQLGNLDAAESSAKRLQAMDPLHNVRNGEQLLAAILARKADYPGALAHLRNCLRYTPEGPNAELLRQQIAQLEKHVAKAN